MGDGTAIEWTDATWNCLRGCTRVSKGCQRCYAEAIAARFSGPGMPYDGTITDGRWNGQIKLVPEHLADPLRWKEPRRIFVNSMSDLFHEGVPDDYIAAVFGVMAAAPRHTFQVLTKRLERALRWFTSMGRSNLDALQLAALGKMGLPPRGSSLGRGTTWPLPNVWIGASVEDQRAADERIPLLLQIPAAVRFLSCEPLIGPVDLGEVPLTTRDSGEPAWDGEVTDHLHWVICGGESGPKARPCEAEWLAQIVHDCARANVPVFVKQGGACYSDPENGVAGYSLKVHPDAPQPTRRLKSRKGADLDELRASLRVRQFPEVRRG